jgi:hypothetical protein
MVLESEKYKATIPRKILKFVYFITGSKEGLQEGGPKRGQGPIEGRDPWSWTE